MRVSCDFCTYRYGLRCKREVWRTQYTLAKIRAIARSLLTLPEKVFSRYHSHVRDILYVCIYHVSIGYMFDFFTGTLWHIFLFF